MAADLTRMGLLVPSSNTVTEPEFYEVLPEGVTAHAARMKLTEGKKEALRTMVKEALPPACHRLATADVDVAVYACTTGSLHEGAGFEDEIEARVSETLGVPVVATAASVQRAFDALSLSLLALATPYTADLTEDEVEFLRDSGYSVVDVDERGFGDSLDMGNASLESVRQQVGSLEVADADGVFISCTNYRTFPIIEKIESETGLPVVTSNQATLWDALQELDVDVPASGPGVLFDQ